MRRDKENNLRKVIRLMDRANDSDDDHDDDKSSSSDDDDEELLGSYDLSV